jgi:hypothetical protein
MNQNPNIDPAAAVAKLRHFLYRVMMIPIGQIKVTGNPATDENTDILKSYQVTEAGGLKTVTIEKLDAIEAMRIDCILDGTFHPLPNGVPDIARGAKMFSQFVAQREKLYP